MNSSGAVYLQPDEVAGRLDALGVDEQTLRESAKEGLGYVLDCTRHDPLYLPGILGSGKTVRALRDRLISRGWTYSNPRNYALTTDPTGAFAIVVAGGDANTGTEATPTTRTEKGPATRDAIYGNIQLQLSQIDPKFPRIDAPASVQTWLLLHYVDEAIGEIRMELSEPGGMDRDGYVTSWRERIVLRPEPFGRPEAGSREQRGEEPEEVDVQVERRASAR